MRNCIKKLFYQRYRECLTIAHFLLVGLIAYADSICSVINQSTVFITVYFSVVILAGVILNVYTLKNRWRLVPKEGKRDRLINPYTAVLIVFVELFALLLKPYFFELT